MLKGIPDRTMAPYLDDEHGIFLYGTIENTLHMACGDGEYDTVKILLSIGKVDADAKDARDGRTPLSRAAEQGYEAIVAILLNAGKVDVNAKDDEHGPTVLSWAAQMGNTAVVKLLLDTGKVNIDAKDNDGRTPLWWAAENEARAMVKQLLDTGKVDVDPEDNDGRKAVLVLRAIDERPRATIDYSQGNHALQDYQMQLMLLEAQKRRQEQANALQSPKASKQTETDTVCELWSI